MAESTRQHGEASPDELPAGLRVLIVDDMSNVLRTASSLVEALGGRPTVASSGTDAVDVLARAPASADVVLMDVNMPGMDGIEALSRMRVIREDCPVVLSSGVAEPGPECGHDAFLAKPYTGAQLTAALREAIERRAVR